LRPPIILSCPSIGTYGATDPGRDQNEGKYDWENISAARQYYEKHNVPVLLALRAGDVPPSDVKDEVVMCCECDYGSVQLMYDMFLMHLVKELDCQFVDNDERSGDMFDEDLRAWYHAKGRKQKVPFVMDRTGSFVPLEVPSRS
jgi:hypothetical protein